jgi:hypothetical protein
VEVKLNALGVDPVAVATSLVAPSKTADSEAKK